MLWLAVPLAIVVLILLACLDTRKPKRFPPGPKWYPLLGSAFQVHKARSRLGSLYEATAELSQTYGPIVGLKIGKTPIVVVYGPQAVKEMSLSEDLLGRPIGEQRRFLVRHLKEFGFGTKNMSILVEEEVSHLIDFIYKSMDGTDSVVFNMESLFSVSILNTIWKMIAGVRYSPEDDKMKTLQKMLSDLFKIIHMIGAAFSHYPILKYIAPELSGYKSYMETHERIWEFLRRDLESHKKGHDPDNPRDLMDVYLNILNSPDHAESFSEEQLLAICMDMFMAGSETTNNSISFGFLYLMLNPRVQKKAQQEIDLVLGNRMPCIDDRRNMPYMEAVTLEALRMFGCRAFVVPHRALKDTYLGGYFIPKDVLIIANLHGCMMGPNSGFENPDKFIPERYLKDGKVVVPENFLPFGLGKRRLVYIFQCSQLLISDFLSIIVVWERRWHDPMSSFLQHLFCKNLTFI
ncbi:hypothetical protein ABEB36_006637 [Hypothenemus hampei]|uniref:Cytochrome P450 n=1 Tax=Hypothenemus hampei TaxID=57062 RepID=A0ABD1ER86_HYPHA